MDANKHSMDEVRKLIIGGDESLIKEQLTRHARPVVAEVFTEALHDRQTQDGSVNKLLVPLVEKSVQSSVERNKDRFVGALYPVVGSLVRKAVSAFLADFVEKTNALLESSLTAKGLSWRWKAWRSGVSYSRYVAAQIYQFQIEQILLIERSGGLLLNSVALEAARNKDADLISAMLSAINDFIADALPRDLNDSEQSLHEVKTDQFTLLLTVGPQAILVAAAIGKVPPEAQSSLQMALEDIHRLYQRELSEFNGDPAPFDSTHSILSECLLQSKKATEETPKPRKPYMGWAVVLLISSAFISLAVLYGMRSYTIDAIYEATPPDGIVLLDVKSDGLWSISIATLRDPIAPTSRQWLDSLSLPLDQITVHETPYLAVSESIVGTRLHALLERYPAISLTLPDWELSGTLHRPEYVAFIRQLENIPGIELLAPHTGNIKLTHAAVNLASERAIQEQIFNQYVGEVARIQIDFASGSAELDAPALAELELLSERLSQTLTLAKTLNYNANVLIIGASDSSGSQGLNRQLSQQRANQVKSELIRLGLPLANLFTVGIGEVNMAIDTVPTRRVLFNIIYAESKTVTKDSANATT